MTRRNITKEAQKAIDEGIMDLLSGRYKSAEQRFKNVVNDLKNRVNKPPYGDRFKPYFWTASLGQGLAEGMIEGTTLVTATDISDIAKEANKFYNAYVSLGEYGDQDVTCRNLGKSYISLGFEREGIGLLEQLRRPRLLDFARLSSKARELLSDKQY